VRFRKLEIFQGGAAIHRCVWGLGGEKIGDTLEILTYNHPTPVDYATDRINIGMQSSRDIASEWQVSLPPRVGVQNLFSSAGMYPLQCAAAPVSLRLATALITCPPSPGGTAGGRGYWTTLPTVAKSAVWSRHMVVSRNASDINSISARD